MRLRCLFLCLAASLVMLGGCSKSFNVAPPTPSSVDYSAPADEEVVFTLEDVRSGEDRQFSIGTITAYLDINNEVEFLKEYLEKELKMRGVHVGKGGSAAHPVNLEIHKYRIRNQRTTGFSPYFTFMTFSADLYDGSETHRITSYFKNGKVPIWTFREVENPCYNIPISLMVKEVASKVNRYVMKNVASDAEVDRLAREIQADPDNDYVYLKVLELGYTNNPKAIAPLMELTRHDDSMVQSCAVSALGMLQAEDQLPFLIQYYREHDNTQKFMALKAIGDMDTEASHSFMDSVRNSEDYNDEEMIKEVVDLYY
ncbi:HEAT repeat domain-containing protein [Maridesulfovibrio sp.]|uniref:HEAT repeat domain-containing protein n=1 Tax=Maridesulfovibrio sp. TaxID=2795000 RepID=UPI002AA8439C|nr:HEAT repeat domain-containing protein [Maridesulfovibrio sp.]